MEFAGYRVVRLLGRGGMSEVYEVEDASSGAHYALKLFAYARDEGAVRARFEMEGRLLARLDHPRIVKVHGIGVEEETGRPYFVMDLVLDRNGELLSLGDVPDGAADEETIGRWYDDVREGLAYIHGRGIVHRDLKLQNVLVGVDGHAVITDFGISRVSTPDGGVGAVVDPVHTVIRLQNGEKPLMGSIGYMAPELEMGLPASPQSDWYALGVIVYKLLTGMWCDARTDVVGTLGTYNSAWGRIVPRLLHSNPQGRECLSYAEEMVKDREVKEFDLEEKWLREKCRGHRARHVARYAGALVLLLLAALGFVVHDHSVQCDRWQRKIEKAGATRRYPGFDELFAVPAEAKADEQIDDDNNVIMYSRPQFEAAWVDALILTHRVIAGLESGNITLQRALEDMEKMYRQLDEDSLVLPFDGLRFGDNDYMPFGDPGPLRVLFGRAIEKLKRFKEQ